MAPASPPAAIASWTPPATWAGWSETPAPLVPATLGVTPTPYVCPTPSGGTPTSQEGDRFDCLLDSAGQPLEPVYLLVTPDSGATVVRWRGTGSSIATHYEMYRQGGDGVAWRRVAIVAATPANQGWYAWHDRGRPAGGAYRYGVLVVDRYGNRSSLVVSDLYTAP